MRFLFYRSICLFVFFSQNKNTRVNDIVTLIVLSLFFLCLYIFFLCFFTYLWTLVCRSKMGESFTTLNSRSNSTCTLHILPHFFILFFFLFLSFDMGGRCRCCRCITVSNEWWVFHGVNVHDTKMQNFRGGMLSHGDRWHETFLIFHCTYKPK